MPLQIRRFDDISIHALREEGDLDDIERDVRFNVFLSTPSARRATSMISKEMSDSMYFYPRPPRGGRLKGIQFKVYRPLFLSTPSARRATGYHTEYQLGIEEFLSTPSARRATLPTGSRPPQSQISIHALREEGDVHDSLEICVT